MSASSGTVSKNSPPNCVMTTCKANVTAKLNSISLFLKRFLKMLSLPSSRQLKALNSWNNTNSVKMTEDIIASFPSGTPRKLKRCCIRHITET